MAAVFLSIGSNIEREYHVQRALDELATHFGALKISTWHETDAVGFDGPPFLNLVVGFQTTMTPMALCHYLRSLERAHGRAPDARKFSSRSLDLDLLLYDDLVLQEEGVCIPRSDILNYAFVLEPLAEIAGDLRHPLLGVTYKTLWLNHLASAT